MDRFKFRVCLKLATKSILLYSNNVDFDNKQIRLSEKDFKKQIESYNLTPEDNEILWKHAYYEEVDYYPDVFVEFDDMEQSTGLKDKNGNLLYEGDIVYDNINDELGIIEFDEDEVKFGILFDDVFYDFSNAFELELYGNIHENKDLLEAK